MASSSSSATSQNPKKENKIITGLLSIQEFHYPPESCSDLGQWHCPNNQNHFIELSETFGEEVHCPKQ